jgi:hypothetical protein
MISGVFYASAVPTQKTAISNVLDQKGAPLSAIFAHWVRHLGTAHIAFSAQRFF